MISMTDKRTESFLKALGELTALHGIEISGCGCCGSPYLWDNRNNEILLNNLEYNEDEETYE